MNKFIKMHSASPMAPATSPSKGMQRQGSTVSDSNWAITQQQQANPIRLVPSQIHFEDNKLAPLDFQKSRGQDFDPPQMFNAINMFNSSPSVSMQPTPAATIPPTAMSTVENDVLLPAIHEEFKTIDVKSVSSVVVT